MSHGGDEEGESATQHVREIDITIPDAVASDDIVHLLDQRGIGIPMNATRELLVALLERHAAPRPQRERRRRERGTPMVWSCRPDTPVRKRPLDSDADSDATDASVDEFSAKRMATEQRRPRPLGPLAEVPAFAIHPLAQVTCFALESDVDAMQELRIEGDADEAARVDDYCPMYY